MTEYQYQITKGFEIRIKIQEIKSPIENPIIQLHCEESTSIHQEEKFPEIFEIRANNKEHFNFEIELLDNKTKETVGKTLFLSDEFKQFEIIKRAIVHNNKRVGSITIEYIVYSAFTETIDKQIEIDFHHKVLGHRGSGQTSRNIIKNIPLKENTLNSYFVSKENRHADFIEFDVQLSLDKKLIIHHDLIVKINCPDIKGIPQMLEVPLNKFTYEEIRKIEPLTIFSPETFENMIKRVSEKCPECSQWKIEQTAKIPEILDDMELDKRRKHQNELELGIIQRIGKDSNPSIYDYKYVNENGEIIQHKGTKKMSKYHSCIPRLDELFRYLPIDLGFDVEIKYCENEDIQYHFGYTSRDEFTDIILKDVFKYCGERKIFFSSFDPMICLLLKKKQSKFPVLFLNVGHHDEKSKDPRRFSLENAFMFCQEAHLDGIVVDSKYIYDQQSLIDKIFEYGLHLLTYGEDNNNIEKVKKQLEMGIESICTDSLLTVGSFVQNYQK